ncbi:MAG: endonuclease domain-containing protein [Oscillospiraceae bacterium]|nr:endonuclease domain-containing protein [Oscillospiraceae bacterium]
MNPTNNPRLRTFAQKLRREMTKEERHLWYDFLCQLPVSFRRQRVIGPYIVDFYCASARLVIELDGSQHFETAGLASDRARDAYLNELGLRVLRYSNRNVNRNFDGVCADILRYL